MCIGTHLSEPVFLLALAIFATAATLVAKAIAGAIAGRGASRSELAQITERLEQQAALLEDAQISLADQSTQLAELQERLDFAERLLAKARDRGALGPGEKRE
jgi:exonuclease VII small subunit